MARFQGEAKQTLDGTKPLIHCVPGNFSAAVKQPGRAAYDLPLSNDEARNTWSHTSTPPYAYTACTLKISHLPLQSHNIAGPSGRAV